MEKEIINEIEYIQWSQLPVDMQEELDYIIKYNDEKQRSETVAEIVTKVRTRSRNPPPDHQIFKIWIFENFEYTSNN